jgi:hypothetical protein
LRRWWRRTFGEITGTVADASGALVSGAVVTLTNTATNQVRRITTNDTGNYSAPFLVPGPYQVRVEKTGFKVDTRRGVDLQLGGVARIDFRLEVGEVSQQVEVTGGAPLLATESTALGTVIENRRIVELPLNGRNYLQLVTLSPNVTTEGGSGGAYSLGGVPVTQAAVLLRAQTSLSIAGAAVGIQPVHPRRHREHRSELELVDYRAQRGRHSGVQSADRRVLSRIRPVLPRST